MKFKKKDLQDMVYEGEGPLKIVDTTVSGHSRWSVEHSVVFKDTRTGKFYRSYYSVGATEMQDEQAYEYAENEVSCREVVSSKVETVVWIPIGGNNESES